jgi:hypothetical protein
MNDEGHRAVVEAAYARLRDTLQTKEVSVEGLRSVALEALERARAEMEVEIELDPDWLVGELRRLSGDSKVAASGGKIGDNPPSPRDAKPAKEAKNRPSAQ